ncbi:MAG: nodulation protein NfeD [Burkholderiales bacterium]|nr:nodulation protein NfeD [Burkholderiales bacterium]
MVTARTAGATSGAPRTARARPALAVLAGAALLAGAPLSDAAEEKAAAAPAKVVVLSFDGAVTPAISDYLVRGMRRAADGGAALVVVQMDTPGGLDTSMRDIIKQILASTVPVAVFVGPSGARAASAGTYILYASHFAAMAPATNLGAATPVAIGIGGARPGGDKGEEADEKAEETKDGKKEAKKDGAKDKDAKEKAPAPQDTLSRKQIHDASAYIRGLAQLRGRNAEWAERAVREAVSLSAKEALEQKVIDIVATDVADLIAKLDGRKVTVQGVERTLALRGAATEFVHPDWRTELLAVITNPSVALILMMIGIYGLFFEFSNPGFVLPGVVGAISLLLGLFALQLLPVNYAGLALMLLGLAFMVAEAFLPSFGALGIGGVVAFVFGGLMLIDTDMPGFGVPVAFIVTLGVVSALLMFAIVGLAIRARSRPVLAGREEIAGSAGVVVDDFAGEGWVRTRGELWRAVSVVPLAKGERVRVKGTKGLVLEVEPEQHATQGEKT